jgi:hypothetical protein
MAAAAAFVAVKDIWLEAVTPVKVTVSVAEAVVVREPTSTFPFRTIFEMVTFIPEGAVICSVTLYATGR